MPRVSVIIPTYDRAALLREALASVRGQVFRDFEVIVVDDGSTDGTDEVVAASASEAVLVRQRHDGHPGKARNRGLEVATGEYVAFLDSDDVFLPDKLALQTRVLDAAPESAMVYSDALFFRTDVSRPTGRALDGMPTPSGDALPDLLRGSFLFPAMVLMRRTSLGAVGRFDERFEIAEDYDLWLRIAARFPVTYAPGTVAGIRRHPGSLSREVATARREGIEALRRIERLRPDLARRHRSMCREGYARAHSAVAQAELCDGNVGAASRHAQRAAACLLRAPWPVLRAAVAWRGRRALRRGMLEP